VAFDDEIPTYRPKARVRRVRTAQDSSFQHAVISRLRGFGVHLAHSAARARIAVRPPGKFARRVILKARYVQTNLQTSARLHLAYVEREGVERDGTPGRLYDAGPGVSDATRNESVELRDALLAPIEREKHQFRMILAPEDGRELDLTAFTRDLMARVERDMKQRLIWGAVNHYDTDQPHTHLIVRGVDRSGAEVRFPRAYIQRGLRQRAQELATEYLGPRTKLDHEKQLAREVRQGRLTSLDRRIAKCAVAQCVHAAELGSYERERMRVLEAMRLAEPLNRTSWRLAAGWTESLKADGERGDIIKQLHRALPLDPSRYQVIDRFAPLPSVPLERAKDDEVSVHGRVVDKGLSDRAADGMYVVVETARGGGYFVPLWRSEHANVRVGDLVSLTELNDSWVKPMDAQIEVLARLGGGEVQEEVLLGAFEHRLTELVHAGVAVGSAKSGWSLPENFLGVIESSAPMHASKGALPEAVDALLECADIGRRPLAHEALLQPLRKRLGELEELGLAKVVDDNAERGRWRVTPELVARLSARDAESPRKHASLRREGLGLHAQVTYEGPTWLDQIAPLGETGLAAELQQAKLERAAYLKERRIKNLRAWERDQVAGAVALELGLAVAAKLDGFVGRVERVHRCPNGHHYAVIASAESLVAVATGKRSAKLIGRRVRLEFVESEYTKRKKLSMKPERETGPGLAADPALSRGQRARQRGRDRR
jgi:type IV secretory pathway VirD2 relaxase